MELSKEQLNCLQLVGSQGILLVSPDKEEICRYLKPEGFIEMITVLTKDTSQEYPPDELHMNEVNVIIQITQKGKSYLASHTKKTKHSYGDIIIKIISIVISIIALGVSIFK